MTTFTWIDVETTGLDAATNSLLEIACIVTDDELNILDEGGYQAVVLHSRIKTLEAMAEANDYVLAMHEKTGLWGKLVDGKPLAQIDQELSKYVALFSDPRTSPVAGNSVRLDMNFMDAYLPLVAGHLNYRMIDVSTVVQLAESWYAEPWFDKGSDHTAMTDIRGSIEELRHYRKAVFA